MSSQRKTAIVTGASQGIGAGIVKAFAETDVRIEEDKNGVKVSADKFDSRMQTLPREDFPTLPEASGAGRASLPAFRHERSLGRT